jgi:hypothetical protein
VVLLRGNNVGAVISGSAADIAVEATLCCQTQPTQLMLPNTVNAGVTNDAATATWYYLASAVSGNQLTKVSSANLSVLTGIYQQQDSRKWCCTNISYSS